MKKFCIFFMTVAMVLSLCACSKNQETDVADVDAQTTQNSENVSDSAEDEITENSATAASTAVSGESTTAGTTQTTVSTKKTTTTTAKTTKTTAGNKKLSPNDLTIGMKVTADTVSSLGTVIDKQSAPSCHFDGNDTIYCYDGFTIYTYADNGVDRLYLVEINDSSVSTAKGACVGMSVSEVKNKYGQPIEETGTSICYNGNNCKIRFSHNGNTVTLIEYEEK
ncbi:MAG: hypothetical protein ACI4XH_09160 [Acutalibacteraceae bacterium]